MHQEWYDNTRNRFNPGNRFIGDIEDGKRYPFGVYTEQESDERYAVKQTETDLAALTTEVGTKAAQADLQTLEGVVSNKADEQECIDIRARLDALEYKDIKINSFTASPSLCEKGSHNTIDLAWSLNKEATAININGTPVTGSSTQFTDIITDTVFTLNVSDGQTNASRSVAVTFANEVYFGVATDLTNVTSLTKVLSNNPARTFTVNAGEGQYIVYAIPVRLGDVAFFVGGFEGGFEEPVQQALDNTVGYREPYYVYRSTNANLGTTTVEVREG